MKNTHAILRRILNLIIVRTPGIPQLGLMDGKTGICILLYNYARKIKSTQIESYAGDLLDSIIEELNVYLPTTFFSGLAGIGWSIEYLKQYNYINCDTNHILSDIDITIFQLDKKKPSLERFYQDFYGYGLYYLARTEGGNKPYQEKEILQLLLSDINDIIENDSLNDNISPYYLTSFSYVVKQLIYMSMLSKDYYLKLSQFIKRNSNNSTMNPIDYKYLSNLKLIDTIANKMNFPNILSSASQYACYDLVFATIKDEGLKDIFKSSLFSTFDNENDWKKIIKQTENAFGFLYGWSGWGWILLKEKI